MKISAFPKCWIEDIDSGKMDLFDWIELSTVLECEGLELMPSFLREQTTEYNKKVLRAVQDRGMVVSMMCYSPDFTVEGRDELERQIEDQKKAIRLSAELDCSFCRTLSGQKRPGLNLEKTIDQVAYAIEACLSTAEKHGVNLVIENHFKDSYWLYPEFAQKMEVFISLINKIDSPWFGVQFDPSNSLVAGEDPVVLLDRVLPRVKTMHASDRYVAEGYILSDVMLSIEQKGYPEGLLHGVTGKGLNDYDAIFTRLRSIGYDGWVSIEDGMNGMGEMKESVDFLKVMRDKYFTNGCK
jgi:Sugar phosphate isomerases/epimerases